MQVVLIDAWALRSEPEQRGLSQQKESVNNKEAREFSLKTSTSSFFW